MDGGGHNGQRPDVPWASVFDPAANLRALTTIQAEGFRAASEIVDRVVRMAAQRPDGTERSARQATPMSAEQRADLLGATDVEPLIRSWWAMVGQFLMGTGSQIPAKGPTVAPALDFWPRTPRADSRWMFPPAAQQHRKSGCTTPPTTISAGFGCGVAP